VKRGAGGSKLETTLNSEIKELTEGGGKEAKLRGGGQIKAKKKGARFVPKGYIKQPKERKSQTWKD